MTEMYIPERFYKAVALHLIKNQLDESYRMPLILGIHGKPGDGKTYQCEQALKMLGAKSFLISGGQLESQDAGRPAELIRNTYLDAGSSIDMGECSMAVMLINDIDTGLGNWGDSVQYTINRQTAFGELMHLVDYPYAVENQTTRRIPIIITGNDFSKLYEPLVRAGRMVSFFWEPTLTEKTGMVLNLFPQLERTACTQLIQHLENIAGEPLTIAFFAHLKSVMYDDILWQAVNQVGLNKVITSLKAGGKPALPENSITLQTLAHKGEELLGSRQLINHLKDTHKE